MQISSSSEKVLYDRKEGVPHFDGSIGGDAFIRFAFQGTRKTNCCTNLVSQKVENFKPIYDWFKDQLELVAPDSRFEPFERFIDEGHRLYAAMNTMLPQLDTGIANLGGERIPFENIPLPEALKARLHEDVKEGVTVRLRAEPGNERYVVSRENGELAAKKLVAYHPKSDGGKAEFEMRHESDGSQRLVDLLPAFLDASEAGSKKVYVIDEVDRSLHTLLTRHLLKAYLANCSTEHPLPDSIHHCTMSCSWSQQLLRRDEMWVAERNAAGASNLFSSANTRMCVMIRTSAKAICKAGSAGSPVFCWMAPSQANAVSMEAKGKSDAARKEAISAADRTTTLPQDLHPGR